MELMNFSSPLIQKQAIDEIFKCNDYTARFGLALTYAESVELVETRAYALKGNGRIEFGGGVIDKIIKEFCDSPYISGHNYAQFLHELTEMFYYYKNETLDLASDDELISFMKQAFDGVCQGSLALLSDRELPKIAQELKDGHVPGYLDDENMEEGDEDDWEWD